MAEILQPKSRNCINLIPVSRLEKLAIRKPPRYMYTEANKKEKMTQITRKKKQKKNDGRLLVHENDVTTPVAPDPLQRISMSLSSVPVCDFLKMYFFSYSFLLLAEDDCCSHCLYIFFSFLLISKILEY